MMSDDDSDLESTDDERGVLEEKGGESAHSDSDSDDGVLTQVREKFKGATPIKLSDIIEATLTRKGVVLPNGLYLPDDSSLSLFLDTDSINPDGVNLFFLLFFTGYGGVGLDLDRWSAEAFKYIRSDDDSGGVCVVGYIFACFADYFAGVLPLHDSAKPAYALWLPGGFKDFAREYFYAREPEGRVSDNFNPHWTFKNFLVHQKFPVERREGDSVEVAENSSWILEFEHRRIYLLSASLKLRDEELDGLVDFIRWLAQYFMCDYSGSDQREFRDIVLLMNPLWDAEGQRDFNNASRNGSHKAMLDKIAGRLGDLKEAWFAFAHHVLSYVRLRTVHQFPKRATDNQIRQFLLHPRGDGFERLQGIEVPPFEELPEFPPEMGLVVLRSISLEGFDFMSDRPDRRCLIKAVNRTYAQLELFLRNRARGDESKLTWEDSVYNPALSYDRVFSFLASEGEGDIQCLQVLNQFYYGCREWSLIDVLYLRGDFDSYQKIALFKLAADKGCYLRENEQAFRVILGMFGHLLADTKSAFIRNFIKLIEDTGCVFTFKSLSDLMKTFANQCCAEVFILELWGYFTQSREVFDLSGFIGDRLYKSRLLTGFYQLKFKQVCVMANVRKELHEFEAVVNTPDGEIRSLVSTLVSRDDVLSLASTQEIGMVTSGAASGACASGVKFVDLLRSMDMLTMFSRYESGQLRTVEACILKILYCCLCDYLVNIPQGLDYVMNEFMLDGAGKINSDALDLLRVAADFYHENILSHPGNSFLKNLSCFLLQCSVIIQQKKIAMLREQRKKFAMPGEGGARALTPFAVFMLDSGFEESKYEAMVSPYQLFFGLKFYVTQFVRYLSHKLNDGYVMPSDVFSEACIKSTLPDSFLDLLFRYCVDRGYPPYGVAKYLSPLVGFGFHLRTNKPALILLVDYYKSFSRDDLPKQEIKAFAKMCVTLFVDHGHIVGLNLMFIFRSMASSACFPYFFEGIKEAVCFSSGNCSLTAGDRPMIFTEEVKELRGLLETSRQERGFLSPGFEVTSFVSRDGSVVTQHGAHKASFFSTDVAYAFTVYPSSSAMFVLPPGSEGAGQPLNAVGRIMKK